MANGGWKVLAVLAAAQFLMVLDQAVMNVSISQLVADFDTEVTTIQAVITLYSLVMAALMIAGGKLGDLWGRRRAFGIGHVVYGAGSLLTAVAWSVPVLMLGWSVLEGIGAALVLPALAALTARTYDGADRALAYGVLGGVSGAGIAVGPILGGWATTYLSWRVVFAEEVLVVLGILAGLRQIARDEGQPGAELDGVGDGLRGGPALHQAGAQLVLTSDRAPRDLALKTGLLVAALLSCAAFFATDSLPARARPGRAPPPRSAPALVREPAGR